MEVKEYTQSIVSVMEVYLSGHKSCALLHISFSASWLNTKAKETFVVWLTVYMEAKLSALNAKYSNIFWLLRL